MMVRPPKPTIEERLDDLFNKNPTLSYYLKKEVYALKERIYADMQRDHLSERRYQIMLYYLYSLSYATNTLNLDLVKTSYDRLKGSCCFYRSTLKSKWTVLGFAIGAFIQCAMIGILLVLCPGVFPLVLLALSVGASGFVGSLFGHFIAGSQTKRSIDHLVSHSVYRFFAAKKVERAKENDSWMTQFKNRWMTLDMKPRPRPTRYCFVKTSP